ncbi:MAG: TonB-dependent receptor [Bacteroidales bacterium]|nr:TonB-dependent receptor [Bacteroidales bacterium]
MKKILTTTFAFLLANSVLSQAHNEQVTVVAPHQPVLIGEFRKINISPQTIDSVLVPRAISYSIFSRQVPTVFPIDNIRPARIAGEPLSVLSPLHARAGFGNYNTWYGELFYGSGRSRNWEYGTHLKHRSSHGRFSGHEVPFNNSVNLIRLFGNYFGSNVLLSADFHYDRRRVSAYGADSIFMQFDPGSFDEIFYKRVFNNLGGSIGFSDNQTEVIGFRYSGRFNIDNIQSNHRGNSTNANELSLGFSGNINQTFAMFRPNLDRITVGLDASMDWHRFEERNLPDWFPGDPYTLSSTMLQFRPYGKFYLGQTELSVGLQVNIFDEPVGGVLPLETETQTAFFPTIHARINLLENILSVHLGMDGNAKYSTFRRIVERNPFVVSSRHGFWGQSIIYPIERRREYYLGLNTTLSRRMDFSVRGSFIDYRNMLNFLDDMVVTSLIGDINRTPFFIPSADNVNIVRLQANLNYQLDDRVSVSAMARWNSYDRSDILYMPTFEANLAVRYNIENKIILRTQLEINAGRQYTVLPTSGWAGPFEINTFSPIVDWSIGAEYRFNRRWGAFVEFNNILNQRYHHWFNYRSFGTNFLIGATFNL